MDEERSRKTTVLFPIRVDDAVLNTSEAWARGLRIQRNIGDFLEGMTASGQFPARTGAVRRLNGPYGPACATFRSRNTRSKTFW